MNHTCLPHLYFYIYIYVLIYIIYIYIIILMDGETFPCAFISFYITAV